MKVSTEFRLDSKRITSCIALFLIVLLTPLTTYADVPRVVVVNGQKELKLPELFVRMLPELAPGFRIPNHKDLKLLWESDIEREQGVPFVCWGDYDGNGSTDIGIFLAKGDYWEFYVFLLEKGKYEQRLVNLISKDDPQNILVKTLKKDTPFTYKGEKRSYTFKYPTDSILYFFDNGRVDIYRWENGKLNDEMLGDY